MATKKTVKISELLNWSPPKQVETKKGTRLLCKASPTKDFWDVWRSAKQTLKDAGVSCGKDSKSGEWEVLWWKPLPKKTLEQRQAAVEASHAVSADVSFPSPDGLEYLPYQKAGIAYCLERFNSIPQATRKENNGPSVGGVIIADEMGL